MYTYVQTLISGQVNLQPESENPGQESSVLTENDPKGIIATTYVYCIQQNNKGERLLHFINNDL